MIKICFFVSTISLKTIYKIKKDNYYIYMKHDISILPLNNCLNLVLRRHAMRMHKMYFLYSRKIISVMCNHENTIYRYII
jgi:hypothetical protein